MGIRTLGAVPAHAEGALPSLPEVRATAFRAAVPPHAELSSIRTYVESLSRAPDSEAVPRREAPGSLRRTVETLAAILDLHGEFRAADEARAILVALGVAV